MGKQGPCGHCGIATTPLWRNGPPEKPVLCNACGSRWRTKGTLLNYMPMHSGGFGGFASPEGSGMGRGRKNIAKLLPEPRFHKRKEPAGTYEEGAPLRSHNALKKSTTNDSIFTSSLSSFISGSDDGAFFVSSPAKSDFAAVSSPPWEGRVPSRKRTSTARACTSVNKLIRQFQDLLYEDSPARSSLTSETAEDILVDRKPSTMTDEIGLGSVFIRQPLLQQFKSESFGDTGEPQLMDMFPLDSRLGRNGAPLSELPNGAADCTSARGKEKAKQVKLFKDEDHIYYDRDRTANYALLENFPYNKRDVLQSCQSPLVFLDLKDIVNFDTFTGLLTDHEQGQLMQLLSSEDAASATDSLKQMFISKQFDRALANFQELLSESMFESSATGVSARILQHYQKLLTTTDLTTSGWMEQYSQLQHRNRRRGGSFDFAMTKDLSKDKLKVFGLPRSATSKCKQPTCNLSCQFGAGVSEEMLITGIRSQNGGPNNVYSLGSAESGSISEAEDLDSGSSSNDGGCGLESGVACFCGSSQSTERVCGMGSFRKDALPDHESSVLNETGADLLFDNPTNMMSLQDTGLTQQHGWEKSKKEPECDQVENSELLVNNIWHMESSPSELFWNPICAGSGYALPNGAVLNPGRMLT